MGTWEDRGEAMRVAQIHALHIDVEAEDIASRAIVSRELGVAVDTPIVQSHEDNRIVDINVMAKRQSEGGSYLCSHIGLKYVTTMAIYDHITTNTRLHRIEKWLSWVRSNIKKKLDLVYVSSGLFSARLQAWSEAAAEAACLEPEYRSMESQECSMGGSILSDLKSWRSEIDVMVHLGTPFDGAELLAAIQAIPAADLDAESMVRAAIREAWTQPTVRVALSQGSHLLVSSLHHYLELNVEHAVSRTFDAAKVIALVLDT
mmetsp:Transcript_1171/g.3460  ORF Transcript_1171/g.3460 Transcript_1171/m.3460 type:complete len:260 (-) Transcript_1171:4545-5324(-)